MQFFLFLRLQPRTGHATAFHLRWHSCRLRVALKQHSFVDCRSKAKVTLLQATPLLASTKCGRARPGSGRNAVPSHPAPVKDWKKTTLLTALLHPPQSLSLAIRMPRSQDALALAKVPRDSLQHILCSRSLHLGLLDCIVATQMNRVQFHSAPANHGYPGQEHGHLEQFPSPQCLPF